MHTNHVMLLQTHSGYNCNIVYNKMVIHPLFTECLLFMPNTVIDYIDIGTMCNIKLIKTVWNIEIRKTTQFLINYMNKK